MGLMTLLTQILDMLRQRKLCEADILYVEVQYPGQPIHRFKTWAQFSDYADVVPIDEPVRVQVTGDHFCVYRGLPHTTAVYV